MILFITRHAHKPNENTQLSMLRLADSNSAFLNYALPIHSTSISSKSSLKVRYCVLEPMEG